MSFQTIHLIFSSGESCESTLSQNENFLPTKCFLPPLNLEKGEHLNVLIFKPDLLVKWDGTLPLCVRHIYNWYLLEAHDLANMLDTFIGV